MYCKIISNIMNYVLVSPELFLKRKRHVILIGLYSLIILDFTLYFKRTSNQSDSE